MNDLLTVQRDIDSPPGGWRYTVPETGVTLKAGFYRVLKDRIVKHLKANGHEITDELMVRVEDGVCRETKPPGSWCSKAPSKPIEGMPLPLLSRVEAFLKCIWASIVSREFVSREEAERRISICMACPLRSEAPGGCSGCYSMLKKASKLMRKKDSLVIQPDEGGTIRDACSACWCLIPLKVWMGNATLDRCEGGSKPPYHESCWRL